MSNCPRPGKCIYDDFRRCGVHFCVRAKCMYQSTKSKERYIGSEKEKGTGKRK